MFYVFTYFELTYFTVYEKILTGEANEYKISNFHVKKRFVTIINTCVRLEKCCHLISTAEDNNPNNTWKIKRETNSF